MRSPFHIGEFEWPKAHEDLADVPISATRVRLVSRIKNLDQITKLENLEALWCFDMNRESIRLISRIGSLERLHIENIRQSGALELLSRLEHLRFLSLDTCGKEENLHWLEGLPQLSALRIENFRNVRDISEVAGQRQLTSLSVTGSIWTKMTIDTLEPVGGLGKLKHLDLTNLKVLDDSLTPLYGLSQLENLEIADFYRYDEYARLARRIRGCDCARFQPYTEFSASRCKKCGSNDMVMLTGRRMPVLCRTCDVVRIRRHVDRFEAAGNGD